MSVDLAPLDPAVQRRHELRNVGQALLLMGAMVAMLAFRARAAGGPAELEERDISRPTRLRAPGIRW